MSKLTSDWGKEITVVSTNQKTRQAIFKTNSGKYRTNPQSKEDWISMQRWTGNDWCQFLKTEEYTKIP